MARVLVLFCFCIACLALCSCSKVALGLMGVHSYDSYIIEDVKKASKKLRIRQEDSFITDSLYYQCLGFSKRADIKGMAKDMVQPLQVRVYDVNGKLLGQRANCNVPGFPNLRWNKYGYFDSLPPNLKYMVNDTIKALTLQTEFEYMHPLFDNTRIASPTLKHYVVIYWSRFMGRQSKRLIKQVKKYYLPYANQINYIYINTEPLYY